jgi:transcriptional regulator with XRE-family HTH domain
MSDELRVGARIKAERVRNQMSLSRVSEVTGISKAHLVRLETDENANPSLETLHRLAQAFDVTVADLLGRPRMTFDTEDNLVPVALRAFADEDHISVSELRTLASIRWRKGEEPRTPERWRYIYNSLKGSRHIDDPN